MRKILKGILLVLVCLFVVGVGKVSACDANCVLKTENDYSCDYCTKDNGHWNCECRQSSHSWCECNGEKINEVECGSGEYACGPEGSPGCCPVGQPVNPTRVPAGEDSDGNQIYCDTSCAFTYCGNMVNGCGTACACKECQTCSVACGQNIDCSTCPSTDAGVPGAVTLISPNGTSINPTKYEVVNIPLLWNAVAGSEKYNVEVYDLSTNGLVWQTVVSGATSTTTGVLLRSKTYFWRVQAVNTTCTSYLGNQSSIWSADGYFRIGTSPTITKLEMRNSDNEIVTIDNQGRVQNCQQEIITSVRPKEVRLIATISDIDGWADITSANLRWGTSGSGAAMTLAPGSGNTRTASLTIDLSTWSYSTTTKPLQVLATDSFGLSNNWVASYSVSSSNVSSFKYWSCQIPVSGTIYDAAGGNQSCATGEGFSTPVTDRFNFLSIGYTQVVPDIASVPMSSTPPATYTNGSNYLLWGRDYRPVFNNDIQGTGQLIRMFDKGDAGGNKMTCYPTNQISLGDNVNPYSTNPQVQVDYSYITNQEPWFQVVGAGVMSANRLETNVPVTCHLISGCKPATAINGINTDGGILSAKEVETNSGCDLSGPCKYGETNNWVEESLILSTNDQLTYRTIKNRYLGVSGVGVTIGGNSNMTTILGSGIGGTGVIFVDGDLSVNTDNTVAVGKFLMIVVKGAITFEENVNESSGIFVADGGIKTVGLSDNQLVINGVLYSGIGAPTGNIRFIRGFNDKFENNSQPATVVNYRPDLIFNMPGKVSQTLTGWRTAL